MTAGQCTAQEFQGALQRATLAVFAPMLLLVGTSFAGPAAGQQGRSAREVLDQIEQFERADAASAALNLAKPRPGCSLWDCFLGANFDEIHKLENELKNRAESEVDAAFYYGLLQFRRARKALEVADKIESFGKAADEHFREAQRAFRVASSEGDGAASWNIGVMVENGWGVTAASKLAAAEWFAKSGFQRLADADREQALASLERAERLDAQNPEVARLRRALFPKK